MPKKSSRKQLPTRPLPTLPQDPEQGADAGTPTESALGRRSVIESLQNRSEIAFLAATIKSLDAFVQHRRKLDQSDEIAIRQVLASDPPSLNQAQIADTIKLARSSVNVHLSKASGEEPKLLKNVAVYVDPDESRAREVRQQYVLTPRLQDAVDWFVERANKSRPTEDLVPCPEVHAAVSVPTWYDEKHTTEREQENHWELAAERAAAWAAPEIAKRIADKASGTPYFAVGWGRQLHFLVSALEQEFSHFRSSLFPPNQVAVSPLFFPVWGSPLLTKPIPSPGDKIPIITQVTATTLAERLSRWFDVPGRHYSLHLVPGFIPDQISKDELPSFESYLSSIDDFREIFIETDDEKDPRPLVDKATGMLAAIGSSDQPPWYLKNYFKANLPEDVEAPIVGDLGGALLWKDDLPPQVPEKVTNLVNKLTDRWKAVKQEQIRTIAKNADKDRGQCGVIAVGTGPDRLDAARAILERGLANFCVFDEHLARAFIAYVDAQKLSSAEPR